MLVPIWVAAWEFECCQPDAVIGERWQASLFLLPVEPWWADQATALSDPELELGVVSLDAQVLRAAPDPDAAARGGSLSEWALLG